MFSAKSPEYEEFWSCGTWDVESGVAGAKKDADFAFDMRDSHPLRKRARNSFVFVRFAFCSARRELPR